MKQIVKTIADKTIEYILSLPNGSNLTMYQAAKAVCPDETERLDELDLYELQCTVKDAVRKTDVVLDFSEHENKLEGLFYNLDFYVYQKRVQKAQIISDLLCYGPRPKQGDPVEQRLTISSNGRIWFTERIYGSFVDNHYPIGRKLQMSIGKERAAAILSMLADYADSNPLLPYCTDIGSWYLTLTGTDGTKTKMSCSMNGISMGDEDLTGFIRARIPIEGLAVFGGGKTSDGFMCK
ncbi:MAG: hypothetical protein LIP11_04075 [Clostridiales bacterium]|nr:hypothetical protein [Clostridiales bacterium]